MRDLLHSHLHAFWHERIRKETAVRVAWHISYGHRAWKAGPLPRKRLQKAPLRAASAEACPASPAGQSKKDRVGGPEAKRTRGEGSRGVEVQGTGVEASASAREAQTGAPQPVRDTRAMGSDTRRAQACATPTARSDMRRAPGSATPTERSSMRKAQGSATPTERSNMRREQGSATPTERSSMRRAQGSATPTERSNMRRAQGSATPTERSNMRRVPPLTLQLLYHGVSQQGQGRAAYLRERCRQKPEEKFWYPILSSWEYGWHVGEAMKDIRPPAYARCNPITKSFYIRNSVFQLLQTPEPRM